MSEEIIFYHNPRSRAQMAHWMLEETGAPYRTVIVDFESGENRKPGFLAVNPMGKVPAIVHRGVTITETGAIIAYLADAFPAAGLAPAPGDAARGAYYRWLFFGAGCFEPSLLDQMTKRPAPDRRVAGYGSYDEVLNALRQALAKGPYLLGERFTAADLYIAAQLNWARMFGAEGVKDDPVFEAYLARATDRAAYRRAGAEDNG